MKRYLCILLALLLLLCACRHDADESDGAGFLFYFRAEDARDSVLLAQDASVDVTALTLEELVRAYLNAEPQEGAVRAVPESWILLSASSDGSTAVLKFSGLSGTVSRMDCSVAYSCLATTLFQSEGIGRVRILSPEDPNGIELSPNSVLLRDTGMDEQMEELTLYFADADERYLFAEKQTAVAMEDGEKPAYIVRQLLGSDHSCIPEGTTLLSIGVENGVCTVNFSSEFVNKMPARFSAERMAVYSVVNSLTELDEIKTVELYVSGAPLEQLQYLSLGSGLVRDDAALSPASDADILDITLYPTCGKDALLVGVPCAIEKDTELSDAEQVMQALIDYEGRDGIRSCIPSGTKLLSLKVEDGECIVDLTGQFLDNASLAMGETLSVRSVVATLTALPEIRSVTILVEGIEPYYLQSGLNSVRTADAAWFAQ